MIEYIGIDLGLLNNSSNQICNIIININFIHSFVIFSYQLFDSIILIYGVGNSVHQYALRFGIKIITNTLLETALC